jgi:hypothetical protein
VEISDRSATAGVKLERTKQAPNSFNFRDLSARF